MQNLELASAADPIYRVTQLRILPSSTKDNLTIHDHDHYRLYSLSFQVPVRLPRVLAEVHPFPAFFRSAATPEEALSLLGRYVRQGPGLCFCELSSITREPSLRKHYGKGQALEEVVLSLCLTQGQKAGDSQEHYEPEGNGPFLHEG